MPLIAPPPPPPDRARTAPAAIVEREHQLLEAYDGDRPLPGGPEGAASLRWLRAAAAFDPDAGPPADPFPPGAARREAEALRSLLKAPAGEFAPRLKALPLRLPGTALALWRWGQAQVRKGRFPRDTRWIWEDRLLAEGPSLTRGYALRHALCWALAERDEPRFTTLKARTDPAADFVMAGFQRLFGLLGGPPPVVRLWRLPDLDYQDLPLDQLGGRQVWVCPAEPASLPECPAGASWIIPSAEGGLDERGASLTPGLLAEGQALAARLQAAGRTARFAPSRAAFESLGLAWFPILIELDARGNLASIRMGDAAPR